MAIAVLSLALSYLVKNRVGVLLLSISNAIFYAMHYLILKEHTAALLNLIGVVRGVWFYLNDKFNVSTKKASVSLVVCLILLVAGGCLTFEHWYSIFPIIATVIYTISVWQKNLKIYRWIVIPVEICGITLNIMCKSIIGIVFESALLITGIISIIYMYVHERHIKNAIQEEQEEKEKFSETTN